MDFITDELTAKMEKSVGFGYLPLSTDLPNAREVDGETFAFERQNFMNSPGEPDFETVLAVKIPFQSPDGPFTIECMPTLSNGISDFNHLCIKYDGEPVADIVQPPTHGRLNGNHDAFSRATVQALCYVAGELASKDPQSFNLAGYELYYYQACGGQYIPGPEPKVLAEVSGQSLTDPRDLVRQFREAGLHHGEPSKNSKVLPIIGFDKALFHEKHSRSVSNDVHLSSDLSISGSISRPLPSPPTDRGSSPCFSL